MVVKFNLQIARPRGLQQRATFNVHKRFNYLKFQAVAAPDGLILHLYGLVEGRRHDITMLRQSNIGPMLAQRLNMNGVQYYIYGDSAYMLRPYLMTKYK